MTRALIAAHNGTKQEREKGEGETVLLADISGNKIKVVNIRDVDKLICDINKVEGCLDWYNTIKLGITVNFSSIQILSKCKKS